VLERFVRVVSDSRLESRIEEYWSWAAVALFLLVTVDLLTTLAAARVAGPAAEANPLVRWALGESLAVLVAINVFAIALAATFFWGTIRMLRRTPDSYRRYFALLIEVWLGALLAVGLFVFANNLAVIVLGESLL
jgi:hypothetical protein